MGILEGVRATIREAIHYGVNGGFAIAPCGEYRLEPHGASVGLCARGGDCEFELSFDSFQQHVIEGRIALRQ